MTTTPATKSTRSTKAPAKSSTSKPAAKASKSTAKTTKTTSTKLAAKIAAAAKTGNVVELTIAKPSFASTPEATELVVLHDAMLAAVEAFESNVIELIKSGVSPTTIGKLVGLGNSSVRRIAMRRSPGLVK